MSDSTTKTGVPVDEIREYALDVLSTNLGGIVTFSDSYQRRLRVSGRDVGSLTLHIDGARPLREVDRYVWLQLRATDIETVPTEPQPETATAPVEVVKVAPEGFELVSAAQMAQFREELAQAQQLLGEERANHKANIAGVQQKALAEMQAYRQSIDAEYAAQKRKDAEATAARSRTALTAKIAEHFAPLLEGWPWNFKEARHVGELVDFIVYDGLEEGHIRNVIFVEVKNRRTGTRVSNPRERMLKDAIENGRVLYAVFTPDIGQEDE